LFRFNPKSKTKPNQTKPKTITNTNTNTNTNTIATNINPQIYSLDSSHRVSIMDLIFIDSYNSLTIYFDSFFYLPLREQYRVIDDITKRLEWIERQGYLASIDLTSFPRISDRLPYFQYVAAVEDLEFICGENSKETYK
jgi:hypothetical protein